MQLCAQADESLADLEIELSSLRREHRELQEEHTALEVAADSQRQAAGETIAALKGSLATSTAEAIELEQRRQDFAGSLVHRRGLEQLFWSGAKCMCIQCCTLPTYTISMCTSFTWCVSARWLRTEQRKCALLQAAGGAADAQ